jgi:hypothetical protein
MGTGAQDLCARCLGAKASSRGEAYIEPAARASGARLPERCEEGTASFDLRACEAHSIGRKDGRISMSDFCSERFLDAFGPYIEQG